MSKLIKTLRKLKKKIGNCAVLGDAWNNLADLAESFDSVFVYPQKETSLRKRNIIYRENFDDPTLFSNINFVFIDQDLLDYVEKIKPVIVLFKPYILIGQYDYIEMKKSKYFSTLGYILTIRKSDCQIWQPKGKK